jgi:hypothetical protein
MRPVPHLPRHTQAPEAAGVCRVGVKESVVHFHRAGGAGAASTTVDAIPSTSGVERVASAFSPRSVSWQRSCMTGGRAFAGLHSGGRSALRPPFRRKRDQPRGEAERGTLHFDHDPEARHFLMRIERSGPVRVVRTPARDGDAPRDAVGTEDSRKSFLTGWADLLVCAPAFRRGRAQDARVDRGENPLRRGLLRPLSLRRAGPNQ